MGDHATRAFLCSVVCLLPPPSLMRAPLSTAAPLTAKRLEFSVFKGCHPSFIAKNISAPMGPSPEADPTLDLCRLADCFTSRASQKPGQTVQMCLLR